MIDAIQKKIEKIRQLPEHMRMRWVIGCVAVSMFIISAFWIFSISSMFAEEKKMNTNQPIENPLENSLEDIQEQMEVLKKQSSEELNSLNSYNIEGLQENVSAPDTSSTNDKFPDTPQSTDYSTLPKDGPAE